MSARFGLECAADGRVLVEGRWESKEAFDAAVAGNAEAQRSRASLEEFGSPEPGLFTEALSGFILGWAGVGGVIR